MPPTRALLLGLALPAGIGLLAWILGQFLQGRPRAITQSAGLVAAAWASQVALDGWPRAPFRGGALPARDVLAWLLLATVPLVLLRGSGTPWSLLRFLPAAFFPLLVLSFGPRPVAEWMPALSASLALVACAASLERISERRSAASVGAVLLVAGSVASLVILLGRSGLIAMLSGAVAATAGLVLATTLLRPSLRVEPGWAHVAAFFLGGCVVQGLYFGSAEPGAVALLILVAFLPWLAPAGAGWRNALASLALAAVPVAAAVSWAWARTPADPY